MKKQILAFVLATLLLLSIVAEPVCANAVSVDTVSMHEARHTVDIQFNEEETEPSESEPSESEPSESEPSEPEPSEPEHTHTPETRNAKEPTCTEQGYTGDIYCSECGELLEKGRVRHIIPHPYDDWYVDEYPSEESIGIKRRKCPVCGQGSYSGVMYPEKDHPNGYDIIATCNEGGSLRLSIEKAKPGHVVFVEIRRDLGYYPAAIYYGTDAESMHAPGAYGEYVWFDMPEGTLYVEVVFAKYPSVTNPFVDVAKSSYYYIPVLWALENGITAGTDSTHFSPNQNCTRAQVVTFLWRTAGEPEVQITDCPFVDINSEAYYYKAVLWALENGITDGTDATHFSPNQSCTRAQVVTFLWRACGTPMPVSPQVPFKDVPQNTYYYLPVLWAVENGITSGTDATHFSPNQSCTRGQIVTFLYRTFAY